MQYGMRPRPEVDSVSKEYWDAAAEGILLLQCCSACRRYQFYPRIMCSRCWSTEVNFQEVEGVGSVYSYSIVYRQVEPGFDLPYVIALVDLPEGVRIPTNIVGPDALNVDIESQVMLTRLREGAEQQGLLTFVLVKVND